VLSLARYYMDQDDRADMQRRANIIAQGVANAGAAWQNQPKAYVVCNTGPYNTICF